MLRADNPLISRKDILVTTFGMKHQTRIGFWNVRTMWEAGKLVQIEAEMITYKTAVLRISEARWNSFGEMKTANVNTLIYSRREDEYEDHKEGVALLLNKESRKSLLEWKPVSERIIIARMKTKLRPVTLIQCYAPTEMANNEGKDKFYGQMQTVLRSIKKQDIIIIMGDLNAQLGNENEGADMIMGKYGLRKLNDNGERFVELCGNFNLTIGGTLFPNKKCHKILWTSPDTRTQNQIDCIAISRTWKSSLLDVRNKRCADVGSDHHIMIAEIRLKIVTVRNKL
jgi:endonuclease/exonuclease/phosphatase family metal-dependent hydrolase